MTEIKFRIYAATDDGLEIVLLDEMDCDNGLWFESDKHIDDYAETIMQFTGRVDKNGKDIYESDIILNPLATEPEDKGWIVFWKDYKWMLRMNDGTYAYEFDFNADFDTSKFEVIGNIYETPEILS